MVETVNIRILKTPEIEKPKYDWLIIVSFSIIVLALTFFGLLIYKISNLDFTSIGGL